MALARVRAIPDASSDPEYLEGLPRAVFAALDYAIAILESDGEKQLMVPPVLLDQARLAAQNGVSLDTVLRRYFAGFALFSNYVLREDREDRDNTSQWLLQVQSGEFDRLIEAVSEAYTQARSDRLRSTDQRLVERINRMLDGEPTETAGVDYDFDGWHQGMVALGPDAADTIRNHAARMDCRALVARPRQGLVWAWLGRRSEFPPSSDALTAALKAGSDLKVASGEVAAGIDGWRLTHLQARAAMAVALRRPEPVVRYREVALLASAMKDSVLIASLHQQYLRPLGGERENGPVLRETLRAFFASGQNGASAAAGLGISRQTVANRLRTVEERLGAALSSCSTDLAVALQLEELERFDTPDNSEKHSVPDV